MLPRGVRSRARTRVAGGRVSNVAGVWTPASLPGLRLWLRADQGVTLSGSAVTQWQDQSGNALHVAQGTPAAQPTYVASSINTRPAISFDGNDRLQNTTANLITTAGAARTVFVVGRSNNLTGGSTITLRLSSAFAAQLMLIAGGSHYVGNDGLSGAQNIILSGTPLSNMTSNFQSTWQWAGATSAPTFRYNRVAQTVASGVQGTESGTLGFEVGANAASQFWNGVLGEIIVCAGALSSGDIDQTESYLRTQWGL